MKKTVSDLKIMETLRLAGIARTPQRMAVLKILQDSNQPLSIGLIREKLETQTNINKVTVYRIVSLFKQKGIIRDVSASGGSVYFEMATSEHPVHPHFSCNQCGMLSCLTPLTFSHALQLAGSRDDYRVDHIEIHISGLCNGCLHATRLQNPPLKDRS